MRRDIDFLHAATRGRPPWAMEGIIGDAKSPDSTLGASSAPFGRHRRRRAVDLPSGRPSPWPRTRPARSSPWPPTPYTASVATRMTPSDTTSRGCAPYPLAERRALATLRSPLRVLFRQRRRVISPAAPVDHRRTRSSPAVFELRLRAPTNPRRPWSARRDAGCASPGAQARRIVQ